MSHISSHTKNTIIRHGSIYVNRRVPAGMHHSWGSQVRVKVPNYQVAAAVNNKLDRAFENTATQKIDLISFIQNFAPKSTLLSEMTLEYLDQRHLVSKDSLRRSMELLLSICGDLHVAAYEREDARQFIKILQQRGLKTGTIRRYVNSINAIFNYSFVELDIQKRSPFERLKIKGEGNNVVIRGAFTNDQLRDAYDEAFQSTSRVKLIFPILGETGCRLAEVIGLRIEDINNDEDIIYIRPHLSRRLKTKDSERVIPILPAAKMAIERLSSHNMPYLFPEYTSHQRCAATHASNALNKWLKKRFGGLTAHSARHSFRDRLRAVEAPLELIDQLGGWSSINTVGSKYGNGYSAEQMRNWLHQISFYVNDR